MKRNLYSTNIQFNNSFVLRIPKLADKRGSYDFMTMNKLRDKVCSIFVKARSVNKIKITI